MVCSVHAGLRLHHAELGRPETVTKDLEVRVLASMCNCYFIALHGLFCMALSCCITGYSAISRRKYTVIVVVTRDVNRGQTLEVEAEAKFN